MNPRRVATELWPTLLFTGGLVVWFAVVGLTRSDNAGAMHVAETVDSLCGAIQMSCSRQLSWLMGCRISAAGAVCTLTVAPPEVALDCEWLS